MEAVQKILQEISNTENSSLYNMNYCWLLIKTVQVGGGEREERKKKRGLDLNLASLFTYMKLALVKGF